MKIHELNRGNMNMKHLLCLIFAVSTSMGQSVSSHNAAQSIQQAEKRIRISEVNEKELRQFLQNDLYSAKDGMFYDIWAIKDETLKQTAFENMWPIVVGAATPEQANRFIDEYLLNPDVFFTEHPIATVGVKDPKFELRMWRGPAWNSMTYWAARGCLNYGRKDAAAKLIEKALDATAKQFSESGTIWEFYHPLGGNPEELQRKPHTDYNTPCKEYLGHNPLIAMARLYEFAKDMDGVEK